jgi:hypothetical protein
MQVSQALWSTELSHDAPCLAVLQVQRLHLAYLFEHVQNLVDGRLRGALVLGPQQRKMHTLQLQDDVSAVECVVIVTCCARAEQVAGVW